jgi:hypothetical protein
VCSHAVKIEIIKISRCDGNGSRCSRAADREIRDLSEAGSKCIDGRFGLVFLVVADRVDLAIRRRAPGLACQEARQDEAIANLDGTICGAADEFGGA